MGLEQLTLGGFREAKPNEDIDQTKGDPDTTLLGLTENRHVLGLLANELSLPQTFNSLTEMNNFATLSSI